MSINNLKNYELTIILNDYENAFNCQDDRIRAHYFIEKKEYDGKKRLPYPITDKNGVRHEFGNYVFYYLVERDSGVEPMYLTRLLDQDPTVLRYLLVKTQERTK